MIYGWSPQIGDPGALGWATVAAYALTAVLCLRAARGADDARRFWLTLAAVTMALGVNKQLDMQSLLTAVARHIVETQGWLAERRGAQIVFIAAVVIVGAVLAGILARQLRGQGTPARLAGLGCLALIAFVLVRAASFHHVDALLMSGALGVRINHVLELSGIALIGGAAALARHERRRSVV